MGVAVGERINGNQCLLLRKAFHVFGIQDWIQAVDLQVDDGAFRCYFSSLRYSLRRELDQE